MQILYKKAVRERGREQRADGTNGKQKNGGLNSLVSLNIIVRTPILKARPTLHCLQETYFKFTRASKSVWRFIL